MSTIKKQLKPVKKQSLTVEECLKNLTEKQQTELVMISGVMILLWGYRLRKMVIDERIKKLT